MSEMEFGIERDPCQYLDQAQIENLMISFKKSKSDDSLLGMGKYFSKKVDHEPRRTLILDHQQNSNQNQVKVFKKKIKKERKKNMCDYRKNICGYITKKIIREYLGPTYLKTVSDLCAKHNCSYHQSKSYYLKRIERVTGPSHVPSLLIPESQGQVGIKASFRQFFEWFLRERYLRYLLIDGKMENKQAYIHYKNNNLLLMINLDQQASNIKEEAPNSNQQMSSTSP